VTRIVAQSSGRGGEASLLGTVEPARGTAATLRWSRFLAATEAEGPGVRAAVWLQGCAVHCPECFNPQLWADRGGLVGAAVARSTHSAASRSIRRRLRHPSPASSAERASAS